MGSRKVAEVRELPDEELLDRLESGKAELFNLRFQMATGQLDNPMRIKQVRHDIARILTILRQRYKESDLEVEVARADHDALEKSRAAQASGELKGTPLGEAIQEVPSDAEDMTRGVGPEPDYLPQGEGEKRPRRLRRRRKQEQDEAEGVGDETAAAEAQPADETEPEAEPEESE